MFPTTSNEPGAKADGREELIRLFVQPLYLTLLHANFLSTTAEKSETFPSHLALASRAITNVQLKQLLAEENWRTQLTASWLIGLSGRKQFTSMLAKMLVESEGAYDVQGYCAALAFLGGRTAKRALADYLGRHLPCLHHGRDEAWALAALAQIEGHAPRQFMGPDLWRVKGDRSPPAAELEMFAAIRSYVHRHELLQ